MSLESQPSFLRPGEPGEIGEPSVVGPGAVRNLRDAFDEEESHVRVYLRIKGANGPEDDDDDGAYAIEGPRTLTTETSRRGKALKKSYEFTGIFDGDAGQEAVFDEVVAGDLRGFVDGSSRGCTVMTYGASGSGKTHSLMGDERRPGIVPRFLEATFAAARLAPAPNFKPQDGDAVSKLSPHQRDLESKEINKYLGKTEHVDPVERPHYGRMSVALLDRSITWQRHRTDSNNEVWVSFFEIYNENIYDLLTSDRAQTPLRLVCTGKGQTYVKGIKWVCVKNGTEAFAVLERGRNRLHRAKTNVNADSSRSHCVFTMKLLRYDADLRNMKASTFRLCDLAGTERAKRTGNKGDRFTESKSINSSLHVLERCLICLRSRREGQVPPYRESKLTSLLQNALSGNEAISMLVTINPHQYAETEQTLKFSAIAKKIVSYIEPVPKKSQSCLDLTLTESDFSVDSSKSLEEEIHTLQFQWELKMEQRERQIRAELYEKHQKYITDQEAYYKNRIQYEQQRYLDSQDWVKELIKDNEILEKQVKDLYKEIKKIKTEIVGTNSNLERSNDLHVSINKEDSYCVSINKIESGNLSSIIDKESVDDKISTQETGDLFECNYTSIPNLKIIPDLSSSKLEENIKCTSEKVVESDKATISNLEIISDEVVSMNIENTDHTSINPAEDSISESGFCEKTEVDIIIKKVDVVHITSTENVISIPVLKIETDVEIEYINDSILKSQTIVNPILENEKVESDFKTISPYKLASDKVIEETQQVEENEEFKENNISELRLHDKEKDSPVVEKKPFPSMGLKRKIDKHIISEETKENNVKLENKNILNLKLTQENEVTPIKDSENNENIMKFFTAIKEKPAGMIPGSGCATVGGSRRKLFTRRENNEMAAEVKKPISSKHLNFDESPGLVEPPKVEKPYACETRSTRRRRKL